MTHTNSVLSESEIRRRVDVNPGGNVRYSEGDLISFLSYSPRKISPEVRIQCVYAIDGFGARVLGI